ncbi:hypothetical protein L2Y96_12915 [Luteibacter aegosomaticola]|uniref:hypothetical protein n=1 Tax=Luteibacter aegosomaticola TaxID=2911538 RepID=UPI001FF8DB32|nr:hypothetical protein [Luteibacter aegosomaticola]UPG88322.1 hypothetical protein L2Y96_12915 [Luteibacter aegosomaticola]
MSSLFYICLALTGTAAFIGLLYIGRTLFREIDARRSRFSFGRLSLFIDDAANELVITQQGQSGVRRLKVGTLAWTRAGYSVRITSFKLPEAFADGKFDPYSPRTVSDYADVWVGEGNAGPVTRWLNHRAARLTPDINGHIRALNAQKKAIAAAARRHLPETPVVECDTGRTIEQYGYVAFLPSGFVYGMDDAEGLPQPVIRVHAGDVHQGEGRTVKVVFPRAGSSRTFKLEPTEMKALQALQETGKLRLDTPLRVPH